MLEQSALGTAELNEDEKNKNESVIQDDGNSDRTSSVINERDNKNEELQISKMANIIQPINSIFTPVNFY